MSEPFSQEVVWCNECRNATRHKNFEETHPCLCRNCGHAFSTLYLNQSKYCPPCSRLLKKCWMCGNNVGDDGSPLGPQSIAQAYHQKDKPGQIHRDEEFGDIKIG